MSCHCKLMCPPLVGKWVRSQEPRELKVRLPFCIVHAGTALTAEGDLWCSSARWLSLCEVPGILNSYSVMISKSWSHFLPLWLELWREHILHIPSLFAILAPAGDKERKIISSSSNRQIACMLDNIVSYIDKKERDKSRPWHKFKLKVKRELSHLEWQEEEEIPCFPGHVFLSLCPWLLLLYAFNKDMIFLPKNNKM